MNEPEKKKLKKEKKAKQKATPKKKGEELNYKHAYEYSNNRDLFSLSMY
jgi:hypothetical protein